MKIINLSALALALAVFTGIGCEKDLNDIGFEIGQRDTIAPYIFTLLDVQPYPCCHEQAIDAEDYVLELLVETL